MDAAETKNVEVSNDRGLRCVKCGHGRFKVIYTRARVFAIVRRRQCRNCAARVTTWEKVVGH
jgi:transcriptional regulator NrdR family protein